MTISKLKMPSLFLLLLTFTLLFYNTIAEPLPHEEPKDHYPDCAHWASEGHCAFGHSRSDYMMKWCTKSCIQQLDIRPADVRHLKEEDQIFYEFEAMDVNGNMVDFERFEGYVTVVVNGARDCLNSDLFYTILEHYKNLYPYTVEVLVFPFDHPDRQTECPDIIENAEHKKRNIHVMKNIELQGENTHPLYKYLQRVFEMKEGDMKLDRPYYFFVNPDGDVVEMHYGAGLHNLKDYISRHAKTDL